MHNSEDEGSFRDEIGCFFSFVGVLWWIGSPVSVLGWQIYTWLKHGVWTPLAMHQVFASLGIGLEGIYHPTDWKGLAIVAQWFLEWPMSIGLPVWGGLLIGIVAAMFDRDTWS